MTKAPLETGIKDREIERPLGLDGRKPVRHGPRFPLRRRQIGAMLAGLAIAAVSGFIALDERPFRRPAQTVVSTPEAVEGNVAGNASSPQSGSNGPAIIKIPPPAERQQENGAVVIRDPSALNQDLRVAHLPDRALIEDSPAGPLPVRAADGRRPFDVYARPWSGARGARVAIVIGGLGVSQTGTQAAIERLPGEITLAFASGGNSLDRWMQAARRQGHEIVMQVPLEPFDYPAVDPGRNTLTVEAGPDENRERLHWALARITNYTGMMNYMGGRFVASDTAMAPLFAELGERGLMYVDDGSSARSLASGMAERHRVPYAAADIAIDGVRERAAILDRLDDLERTARARGFAVGTGSAFDVTIDAVTSWVQEARRRGIEIVPISAVAHDPEKG